MRVKDMIKFLKSVDQDAELLISIDEEGNDFKHIHELCKASGEEDWNGQKIKGYIIYPIG